MSPRVFVVDDEPVIASTLAAILKPHGYSAVAFTSPLEALAAARLRAAQQMIADVVMPALFGIDRLSTQRAKYFSSLDQRPSKIYFRMPAVKAPTSKC